VKAVLFFVTIYCLNLCIEKLYFIRRLNTFTKNKIMASRRFLKRNLNNMVYDIVEECYVIQSLDAAKTEKADTIIDEAADFQDLMLEKINSSKTKADFRPLRDEIEDAAIDFINKLNALS
jgi:hypothetical protein